MSEYLSKKAVLEYTKQNAAIFFDLESYHDFRNAVLSGAFDADESEGTWKATAEVLGRENAQLDSEIQRLRAALEEVRECLDDFWDRDTPRRLYKEVRRFAGQIHVMEKVINQALSTATEPTAERVRNDGFLGEKINEKCPKCGADLLGNKVGDKWCSMAGCDYGINTPEGDGNEQ